MKVVTPTNELTGEALRDAYLCEVKGAMRCIDNHSVLTSEASPHFHFEGDHNAVFGWESGCQYHTDIGLAMKELIEWCHAHGHDFYLSRRYRPYRKGGECEIRNQRRYENWRVAVGTSTASDPTEHICEAILRALLEAHRSRDD